MRSEHPRRARSRLSHRSARLVAAAAPRCQEGTRDLSIAPTLTPGEFAARWRGVETGEKASAQAHFIDLCRLLGQPAPHEADPTGQSYAFEKALEKTVGGGGFADAWKRDFFGWEYKGKRKDLKAA